MRLGLTYDDVALMPQYNNVASRGEPTLETWLTSSLITRIPIIPANMDSVISPELAEVLEQYEFGGDIILHRFHNHTSIDDLKKLIEVDYARPVCISWGVRDLDDLFLMLDWGASQEFIWGVCFDIAHGHCEAMFDIMDRTRKQFGEAIEIIAGNVCTAQGYQDLVAHGANAVKVGVGPGAACTTRLVTGFGVPQFTAIQDCAQIARKLRVPIIADGGIRNSRDIVLALAAGASTVMIGKLFAACEESAAEKRESPNGYGYYTNGIPLEKQAKYRGQASFDFQQEFYGECRNTPEGEAFWIPVTGSAKDLLDELLGGIRAGLTYGGSRSIKELQRKAEFIRVTDNYINESKTRQ